MDSPHDFFSQLNALRDVPRFSTYPFALRESVAEHSYYVALITRYICWRVGAADVGKALSFALMHDAEESMLGGVFYHAKRSLRGYQELAEEKMIEFLKASSPDFLVGRMFGSWKWSRYGNTLEGQIVDLADSLAVLVYLMREQHPKANDLAIQVREAILTKTAIYNHALRGPVEHLVRSL